MKLNRKGFTLVELLAVIIILAVVVGITIPAVLTTTQKAKEKSFITAASTAADWFDRQYEMSRTGVADEELGQLDSNFKTYCLADSDNDEILDCSETNGETSGLKVEYNGTNKDLILSAGLKLSNVESMTVYINPNTGRSCVTLKARPGGDYENLDVGTEVQGGTCN